MLNELLNDNEFTVLEKHAYFPYIQYNERQKWGLVPAKIRQLITEKATYYKNYNWPQLLATDYMVCLRTGNRDIQEVKYNARRDALATLTLAECIEAKGEYLDDIINGIWCICEETSWVLASHNFIYEEEPANLERTLPDVDMQMLDIFASETGVLLAIVNYLLKSQLDKIEPLVGRRISREIKKRIIDPFLTRYDYWWMGYSERRDINNWGPWCVSNCVACVLLEEPETHKRKRVVVRSIDMLERYFVGISEDGGCDEGSTYWGRACGMMLECLETILYASQGKINAYHIPKLKNFIDFIKKTYIGNDFYVNYADGGARLNPNAEMIYRMGIRMNDSSLKDFGAYVFSYQISHDVFPITCLYRALPTMERADEILHSSKSYQFETDFYIKSLQVMFARETTNVENGFFLSAKGGHNNDSHNHNDVGNFIIYHNSEPVIVDIGVEIYTKYHFVEQRYKIWTMQSAYHNLPTINGYMQMPGEKFKAKDVCYKSSKEQASLFMDLAEAYPKEANIICYIREVSLYRGTKPCIKIHDDYDFFEKQDLMLSFMTPCVVEQIDDIILFHTENSIVQMNFPIDIFDVKIEEIVITDRKLLASWKNGVLRRVILKSKEKIKKIKIAIYISYRL